MYIGPGGKLPTLAACTIQGVVNGVHVDSGMVQGMNISIQNVSGVGVLCRSDSAPTEASSLMLGGGSIVGAASSDIFVSIGCTAQVDGFTLGNLPCAVPKADAFGIYVEGDAAVTTGGGSISCMSQDGVSLRNNTALSVNNPTADIQGTIISHCGCTALYAEVGKATATGVTMSHSHWGLIQRSALSSTATRASLFSVTRWEYLHVQQ